MTRIFKYLKKYAGTVGIILLLLIIQANCELALPSYTSDIVNIGIANSGVSDTVPQYLSNDTYEKLEQLGVLGATDVANNYQLNENNIYELKEDADTGMLYDFFKSMLPELDEANIDSALSQLCVQEYGKAGIDLSNIQLKFVLTAGAKMLALALVAMMCAICVGFFASRTAASIGMELREQVFVNVVGFSNIEMEKFSTASLITRSTNDIQQVQMVTVMLLRMVLYAPVIGIGGVIKVLQTDTSMSYIIAVAVACVMLVVAVLFVVAMPKFKLMQKLVDRVNLVAREILTGLPVIRAFSREDHEEKRFDDANTQLMKTQLFTNRAMTFMMPVMMLIMNGVSAAIIWFGGYGVDAGNLQVGDMMAFMTYSMQIIMAFLMITMISIMLPRAGVAAERIDEVINTKPSIKDPVVEDDNKELKGVIRFNDVSFAYPDAGENVLSNITFETKPGEITAIIGSTGSGKSTLVNLIPRFYDVTSGNITIDGIDIRDMTKKKLRSVIGYVPQKAALFSGTIESNIMYGADITDEELMKKAAFISQSEEFVSKKENGFNSSIAQGGANVSGGQKQRLSIARAIARKPKVYIFDDSFSALDFKTDAVLRQELYKVTKEASVIIVAQRVSTILNADRIIVLDEGKVAGIGSHIELMKNNEVYRQIAESQLSQADIESIVNAKGEEAYDGR